MQIVSMAETAVGPLSEIASGDGSTIAERNQGQHVRCPITGSDYQVRSGQLSDGKKHTIMSSNDEPSILNTFQQSNPSPLKSPKLQHLMTLGADARVSISPKSFEGKPILRVQSVDVRESHEHLVAIIQDMMEK